VFGRVLLGGFVMVVLCIKMVPVRYVRVVRGLHVITGLVILGGLIVMICSAPAVFRCVSVMLGGFLVIGHGVTPLFGLVSEDRSLHACLPCRLPSALQQVARVLSIKPDSLLKREIYEEINLSVRTRRCRCRYFRRLRQRRSVATRFADAFAGKGDDASLFFLDGSRCQKARSALHFR
jgi:hypothetical protein